MVRIISTIALGLSVIALGLSVYTVILASKNLARLKKHGPES